MNPFLLAFIRGSTFHNMGGSYERVLLSSLALATGATLAVAGGIELVVDTDATLGAVSVASTAKLTFDPSKSVTLAATQILIEPVALWQISAADGVGAYTHRARTILIGGIENKVARPVNPQTGEIQGFTNAGQSRVINNHGTRYWRGTPKLLPKTKLAAHALKNATSVKLAGDCSDYAIGDEIIVAPTNFAGMSAEERRTLTSVSAYDAVNGSTIVGFATPLTEDHWGVQQYLVDASYGTDAVSLTPGVFTPPDANTPTIYDTRAEVLNISNGNITVESIMDSDWMNSGFGATIMDHPGSQYHDEGVRVIRGGQRGTLARYPFHAHRLSYADVVSPVTFDMSGPNVRVHWPNHGITPIMLNKGTVAFESNAGKLHAHFTGIDLAAIYNGARVTFKAGAGSGLPSNLLEGNVYRLATGGGDAANAAWIALSFTENPYLGALDFVDAGTGTTNTVDLSISGQPVSFVSTGTLPSGMQTGKLILPIAQFTDQAGSAPGTRYSVLGNTITPDSFCINVDSTSGAGSGVHTGTFTKFTGYHPECRRIKCTVDTSENRAYTTHASCGTEISDSIAYDIRGQAFFLEDNSETRTKLLRNTVILVRNPVLMRDRLKQFDGAPESSGDYPFLQSSGFWLSHPDNDVQDNMGVLCDGNGVHNAFGTQGFGISTLVNVTPNTAPIYRWKGNGGHSNWKRGVMTVAGSGDEFGTASSIPFAPQSYAIGPSGYSESLMEGGVVWKNRQGGYTNTVNGVGPNYLGWISGDNGGGDFEGNTSDSVLDARSCAFVGYSHLPGATGVIQSDTLFEPSAPVPRFANATYHFTLFFNRCSYHNYPWGRPYWKRAGQQDHGRGAYSWRDMYTVATASSFRFSTGNKYNNSHPGQLAREPRLAGYPVSLSLANPCVVTVGIADAETGWPEFFGVENGPVLFTRTTGALPSSLGGTTNLGTEVQLYCKNVTNGGRNFNLSLTPGGAPISTAGLAQSGRHAMHPMWRGDVNTPTTFGMGTFIPDPYCYYGQGTTGATPRWVFPYGDNPFFAQGAANAFSCEPSDGLFGLGVSTTDKFIGLSDVHSEGDGNQAGSNTAGLRCTRYSTADMSVIGTYTRDALLAGQGFFFQDFQHTALKDRGRYGVKLGPASGKPKVISGMRLSLANEPGVDITVGIHWDGSAPAPTKVFRAVGAGAGGSVPGGLSVSAYTIACTAANSLAEVEASPNGSKFWFDTARDLVWVRWVPMVYPQALENYLSGLSNSSPEKGERASWALAQA